MIIQLFKALLLGAVQGITEFLPISSTGHLILFEHLLSISQETYGLAFDAALHLGTLIAVLWYFRTEWIRIGASMYQFIRTNNKKRERQSESENKRLGLLLVFGTIPAVIIGLLFEGVVESVFRSPLLVGIALILFSTVLWYVERTAKKERTFASLELKDAIVIGIGQSIALVPGVSRSGITIAAGMFRQLTRAEAARFAFLLSAPIVAGAGGKKVLETVHLFSSGALTMDDLLFFAAGIVSAALFGYWTIKYFLRYLSQNSLMPFIIYRIVVGLVIIGATIFRI